MADRHLGQPGPFLVQRPVLSIVLLICSWLLLAFGGNAPSGAALPVVWQEAVMPLALAGGLLTILCLVTGLMPMNLAVRAAAGGLVMLACLYLALKAGTLEARLAYCIMGLAAAVMIWAVHYTGRALPVLMIAGLVTCLPVLLCVAALVRRHAGSDVALELSFIIWSGVIAVIVGVFAAESYASRIAAGDSSRLAAALTVNGLLRNTLVLGLCALLFGLMSWLEGRAADMSALDMIFLRPIATVMVAAGVAVLMMMVLSFNGWYAPLMRAADKGWLAAGLTAARLTAGFRPVAAAAVLGVMIMLGLMAVSLMPDILTGEAGNVTGGSLGVASDVLTLFGVFAIVLFTTLSFRTAMLVVLPLLISECLVQGAYTAVPALRLHPVWDDLVSLAVIFMLLRQAMIWRSEVARRAKGRELMVRSLAGALPAAIFALGAVSVLLSGISLFVPGAAAGTIIVAQLCGQAVLALIAGQCLAIVMRGVARESERQAVSAMP